MRSFFFSLCLLLAGLLGHAQEDLFKANAAAIQKEREADAIVRKEAWIIDYDDIDKMVIHKYRVVTVLNKKGNDAVDAYQHYNDTYRLKDIEAEIYNREGKRIKRFKENDFTDQAVVDGFSLFIDDRVKYMDYHPVSYPYTVAVSTEIKTRDTGLLPSFSFLRNYGTRVEKAILTINYDKSNFKFRFKPLNIEGLNFKKQETGTGVTYSVSSINPFHKEALAPSGRIRFPRLLISANNFNLDGHEAHGITNWQKLGKWFDQSILKGQEKLSPKTVAQVKKLTQNCKTPLEKAQEIYGFVQKNTRYVSVQIGIGGLQPIQVSDVDAVKYGDCKGLSNYTKALLNAVGVTAYYTHVQAGNEKVDFQTDFPTIGQGNHVILALPQPDHSMAWIDCTSKHNPFGFLGSFTDDRNVLVMKPEGGKIIKTPAYLNKANYLRTTAKVQFDSLGKIKAEGKMLSGGVTFDRREGLENLSPRELKKRDAKHWSALKDLKLLKHDFIEDKKSVILTEQFEVEAAHFGKKIGSGIIFALNIFNKNRYIPARYRHRQTPFEISRGYQNEDQVVFQLPEGYQLKGYPKLIKLTTEFGSYENHLSVKNGQLVYKRKIFIKAGHYPRNKYSAYCDFRKKIARNENIKVIISQSKI